MLYLAGVTHGAPTSAPFDAAWDATSADRSLMFREHSAYASKLATIVTITGGGPYYLHRQYQSEPLDAQEIDSVFSGQMRFHNALGEGANHDQVAVGLRIVSEDGLTTRCTLLAVGVYGTTVLFPDGSPSRNRMLAPGVRVKGFALARDRLVCEVGTRRSVPDDVDDARVAARLWDNEIHDLPPGDERTIESLNAWINIPGLRFFYPLAPWRTQVLAMLASRTANLTGTVLDTADLAGVLELHVRHQFRSGTSPTWAWTLQDADDGATFTNVAGIATAAADVVDQRFTIDRARVRRFVRVLGTIGGSATPTILGCADLRAQRPR